MKATRTRRFAMVGGLACIVAAVAYGAVAIVGPSGAAGDDGPSVLGPGTVTVRLVVQDSHFQPARIHVRRHTEVRFVVVNRDFLNHEFIIGGDEVHARHEQGSDPWHAAVPGEVSIAPHKTAVTTYAFESPGKVLFACHLGGHFAYGMKGYVIVEDA